MIGRYGVAKNSERAPPDDVVDLANLHREIFEERRLVNVIAFLVPLIHFAGARWDFVPLRVLIREIAIKLAEDFRAQRRLHRIAHFFQTRPEIAQKSFFAGFVFADWLFAKIDIHPPGKRERDYQRRRHQEIGFDVLVHPRFEIAVTRKHGRRDQIVIVDRLFDFRMERAGISDAGRAAVADEIEPELVEIFL